MQKSKRFYFGQYTGNDDDHSGFRDRVFEEAAGGRFEGCMQEGATDMSSSLGHLFSRAGQAKSYADFRPDYLQSGIFAALDEYAGPPQLNVALDVATGVLEVPGPSWNTLGSAARGFASRLVSRGATVGLTQASDDGTGSGQAAMELAKRYGTVIAQDPSQAMLDQAQQHSNVRYEVATAEAMGQADCSVDLVTCAQAMHWFDIPAFYREASRVLRPGGTLAVWGYALNTFDGEPAATQALRVLHGDRLGPYWDPKRRLLDEEYRGLEPGPPLFSDVERHEFPMPKPMTVEQYFGYLRSWSSYHTWRESYQTWPESRQASEPDPLLSFAADLSCTLGVKSTADTLPVLFSIFAIYARKA